MSIMKRPTLITAAVSMLFAFASVAAAMPGQGTPLAFRLRTADGAEITSDALRGNVVVLAFGASWLPLSRVQMQGVQELADEYADKNVRVHWVSTDSDKSQSKNYATDEQLRELARKNGLKVAVLRDPDGVFLKKIGADQIPVVVVLDAQGRVAGAPIGGISTDSKHKLVDVLRPRLKNMVGE